MSRLVRVALADIPFKERMAAAKRVCRDPGMCPEDRLEVLALAAHPGPRRGGYADREAVAAYFANHRRPVAA